MAGAPSRAESLAAALALIGAADAVFPAVHGPHGEDGALAALCELAGTPVVGSGLAAGAVGMDKHWSKLVARHAGVRTAPGRLVGPRDLDALTDVPTADEPQVVKPVSSGSSHGVSLVRNEGELVAAVALACTVDAGAERGQGRALVEPVVRGREIDVAVLREPDGTRWAAPALEIHTAGLFDTATKYDGSARFSVPADLDAREASALERAALTVFDALGCRGVARVDFFLTAEGPVFNEINTMPGLTRRPRCRGCSPPRGRTMTSSCTAWCRVPSAVARTGHDRMRGSLGEKELPPFDGRERPDAARRGHPLARHRARKA